MDKPLYRILISIVAFLFLLGMIAGAVTAARIDRGADSHLFGFLTQYKNGLQTGDTAGSPFWQALLNAYLFPLLAFGSGFTLLGVAVLPILLIVRGFMVAFVFTAFVSVFGVNGLWLALGEMGFQCLLSIPCLLVLSAYSAQTALQLIAMAKNGRKPAQPMFPRRTFVRLGVCSIAMMVCTLADFYLSPLLQGWIASLM